MVEDENGHDCTVQNRSFLNTIGRCERMVAAGVAAAEGEKEQKQRQSEREGLR